MPKDGPKMALWHFDLSRYLHKIKTEKKCSPLSLIFDIERPFQKYMPQDKISAKKCPKNSIKITFWSLGVPTYKTEIGKKCSLLYSIFDDFWIWADSHLRKNPNFEQTFMKFSQMVRVTKKWPWLTTEPFLNVGTKKQPILPRGPTCIVPVPRLWHVFTTRLKLL